MFPLMSGTNYFAKKYFLTPFWDSTKFSLFCKVRACRFSVKNPIFQKLPQMLTKCFFWWVVSTTFETLFGKLNFWQKIDRCGPYKIVKILYYLKWGKKIFFGKIICSTHQKKHFYNIWDTFWKIEFLTKNQQARTLQKCENFVLSQNGVRKYFWQNYLFHSSKETFRQHLRKFLENWIFDGKSTGADLTK